jgi:TolB protein
MILLPGCWSVDGKYVLIALMDRETRKSTIWKISPDGREKTQLTGHHENFYRHLALSPDGSLLVYAVLEGRYLGLYIMPAEGGISIPLAATIRGHNEGASWSPNGKQMTFTSTRSGSFDIWMMDINLEQVRQELRMVDW